MPSEFKLKKAVKTTVSVGFLCLFAITSPLILAGSDLPTKPITMKLKEMPLSRLVDVYSKWAEISILNPDIIPPSVTALVELNNVPADKIFAHILRCGGLTYVQYESGIELVQEKYLEGEFQCTLTGDGKIEQGKLVRR